MSKGKVQNGTLGRFNKTLYHCWVKKLRNAFSPLFIDNTYKNVHF